MIVWNDSYSIGLAEVDRQHQQLAMKLNAFLDACGNCQGKEKIIEALSSLKESTIEHFRSEERIMLDYGYPDYDRHKQDHDDFVESVEELENMLQAQGVAAVAKLNLNRMLGDWLHGHIVVSDMQIGEYLKTL